MVRRKQLIWKIKSEFECQRCNACCRQPGFVFLTGKDQERIAGHFRLTAGEFFEKYCREEDGHPVFRMREDGACQFLDENGCSIHAVKPQQCRDFPRKWREEESFDYCEGIRKLRSGIEAEIESRKSGRPAGGKT